MASKPESITAVELADLMVALAKLERAEILDPQICIEVRDRIFDLAKSCREVCAQNLLSEPITILGLSNRAYNALTGAQHPMGGIISEGKKIQRKMETVYDLVSCTPKELLSIRTLGQVILTEIRQKLFRVTGLMLTGEDILNKQLLERDSASL